MGSRYNIFWGQSSLATSKSAVDLVCSSRGTLNSIKGNASILIHNRQDTATSIQYLVRLISSVQELPSELRVLDLCTGTGCIPLLFHHELYAARDDINLRTLGIDISNKALQLAADNLRRVRTDKSWVQKGSTDYIKADVLADSFQDVLPDRPSVLTALRRARLPQLWDVLISNPPYISPKAYWKTTTRSVRSFEPKLALVPPSKFGNNDVEQGDAFYSPILRTANELQVKVVLLEIADLDQAVRVARTARDKFMFDCIEIWREQPDGTPDVSSPTKEFPVIGQGNARSVVCWRGVGAAWLGKSYQKTVADSVFLKAHSASHVNHDPANRPCSK